MAKVLKFFYYDNYKRTIKNDLLFNWGVNLREEYLA